MRLRAVGLLVLVAGPVATLAAACFPDFAVSSSSADASADGAQGQDSTTGGDGMTEGASDARSDADGATPSEGGGMEGSTDSGVTESGPPPFDGGPPFDAAGSLVIEAGGYTLSMHTGGSSCNPQQGFARIDYDFAIDQYETTAGEFAKFVEAGLPAPCDGGSCSLDPHYPGMTWDPSWNQYLADNDYANGINCNAEPNSADASYATYTIDGGTMLPVTCVNWAQAEAYCVWAQKRLPTETEWMIAAQGQPSRDYPWGSDDDGGCSFAIYDGCRWPQVVGSAPAGATPTTPPIYDLLGSVDEWLWDYIATGNCYAYPADAGTDYPGPSHGGMLGNDYVSASYKDSLPFISPPGLPLWSQILNSSGEPSVGFSNLGLRCVRSL